MTGLEPLLLGGITSSVAGSTITTGLLGAGGIFAPAAGSLFTLGSLGTIAGLGSSLFSMMGSARESAAEQQAAAYNIALEKRQTAQEVEKERRATYLRQGAAIAASGAQGRGMSDAMNILMDNAYQSELNILNIKNTGELNENLYRNKAKAAGSASRLSSVAGVLGGVAKLAG